MYTTAYERLCPVCKFKNKPDAIQCEFCGQPLKSVNGLLTTKQVAAETKPLGVEAPDKFIDDLEEALIPPVGISIYQYDGKPIATRIDKVFYLGRKTEDADPIVDLVPFGAFQLGISRHHAMIRETREGYEIIDIDSTNGTWLNEQRLIPNKAYPLPNGGKIHLGRARLIVYHGKSKKA